MTSDVDFEGRLAELMQASAQAITPPVEHLVRAARQRGAAVRRRRARVVVGAAAGVGVVAAAGIAIAPRLDHRSAGSASSVGTSSPSAASGAVAPGSCAGMVRTGPLPSWASGGFGNPQAGGTPYVVGVSGKIAAILFVPLSSPEAKDHGNKVLWVSRADPGFHPLVIDATLAGTSAVVHRTLTGVGPSYVDLPKAGCWHLQLSWDGGRQHDSLDLVYSAPS
jgi:hypothetical protein